MAGTILTPGMADVHIRFDEGTGAIEYTFPDGMLPDTKLLLLTTIATEIATEAYVLRKKYQRVHPTVRSGQHGGN